MSRQFFRLIMALITFPMGVVALVVTIENLVAGDLGAADLIGGLLASILFLYYGSKLFYVFYRDRKMELWIRRKFEQESLITSGVIKGKTIEHGEGRYGAMINDYCISFEYSLEDKTFNDGQTVSRRFYKRCEIGKAIRLRYLPEKPELAIIIQ